MQIVPNWKAAQILELAGPVKSVWQQSDFADLSNRHICERYVAKSRGVRIKRDKAMTVNDFFGQTIVPSFK